MSRLRIEVASGGSAGRAFVPDGDVVRIGRAEHNDLVLGDAQVSGEHARVVIGSDDVLLEDLGSSNGTTVVRGSARVAVDESGSTKVALRDGDAIELGGKGGDATRLLVTIGEEVEPAQVVAVRPVSEIPGHTASGERDQELLDTLGDAQKAIGAARELDDVLVAVADAALALVAQATHATLILKDDLDEEGTAKDAGFVPVMTRIRGEGGTGAAPDGPVPVTRSVFRKVVRERAAVLAADAPTEAFSSESLLGARIRSTIGVPLWRGDELHGVLQIDNRKSPKMFKTEDVDVLGILAANASLAVSNARLIQRLKRAETRLEKENTFLKGRERKRRTGEVQIIGKAKVMTDLLEQIDKVVDTRVTVLVEGETGTGKELIASAVHYRSNRRDKLFVAQNCAALPENLLESELFGHKKGSFTGATEEKKGLFEIADGGTLFLDEVTEMDAALQAKILRVLQEGEVRPVGAAHTRYVNVRVVAATNRNLDLEVKEGRFREDLYYRLKVFPIRVPPLRDRREDISLLAQHFLDRYSKEMGKPVAGFAQETIELMTGYEWPGNVRELENEIQRLVIQCDPESFITADLLSQHVRRVEGVVAKAGVTKGTLKQMVEQVEKYFLIEALREHGNNKTSAAKALGITREGLHKKLRQLNIG